jgi:hypothetical protein
MASLLNPPWQHPAQQSAYTSRQPPVPPIRQRHPACPMCARALPKPHVCPTPVRDTYRSSSEHRRPLSGMPHIRPRRATCVSSHPKRAPPMWLPNLSGAPAHLPGRACYPPAHTTQPAPRNVASFISSIRNASTMMTIDAWPFCSLPTTPPPPKLASCACASRAHAPRTCPLACRVSRPPRSLSMLWEYSSPMVTADYYAH